MEEDIIKKPVSQIEMDMHKKLCATQFIPSRYNFLNGHNGIRPNTLHGLMSNTSAGKSTLFKSIIVETARVMKVLVWLSEEEIVEYQMLIMELDPSIVKNIVFITERSLPEEARDNQKLFHAKFRELVLKSGAGTVFIDNITTSPFYDATFGYRGQTKTTNFLLDFVKEVCSVFYIAHTDKSIRNNHNKMLTPEDIRGAKDLGLQTEYFYGMQVFTSAGQKYVVLTTLKARFHDVAHRSYFLAFKKGTYVGDGAMSFEQINTLFQNRDYLGRRMLKPKEPKVPTEEPVKYGEKQGKLL